MLVLGVATQITERVNGFSETKGSQVWFHNMTGCRHEACPAKRMPCLYNSSCVQVLIVMGKSRV